MGKRRRAREFALQVLYQLDIRKEESEEVLHQFWKENNAEKEVQNFTNILAKGVEKKRLEIDKLLTEYALNWDLSRMSVVDRNILRLGSFEILFLKEIPFAVSINEAIELAKTFGTDDSSKFINGILNRVKDEKRIFLLLRIIISFLLLFILLRFVNLSQFIHILKGIIGGFIHSAMGGKVKIKEKI